MIQHLKKYYPITPRPYEIIFYRKIGIEFLSKYIPTGGSEIVKRFPIIGKHFPTINKNLPRPERVKQYYLETIKMEIGHLTLFAIALCFMLFTSHPFWLVISLIINTSFNLYPALLQRYNRGKRAHKKGLYRCSIKT